MKKVHLTVLGLISFLVIWPLHMASTFVENSYVKLALIFATTLLVTTGFLFSLFGLKNSKNKLQIFYMLLGGLGLICHTFLYAYFVIYGLAVLGSANTSIGLLTYALVVLAPVVIGYKTFGIKAAKDKSKA